MVVWDETYGEGYGHIAIVFSNVTSNDFTSFDQNFSIREICTLENHSYNHVLGFLRYKRTPIPFPIFAEKNKFNWAVYIKKLRERRREND